MWEREKRRKTKQKKRAWGDSITEKSKRGERGEEEKKAAKRNDIKEREAEHDFSQSTRKSAKSATQGKREEGVKAKRLLLFSLLAHGRTAFAMNLSICVVLAPLASLAAAYLAMAKEIGPPERRARRRIIKNHSRRSKDRRYIVVTLAGKEKHIPAPHATSAIADRSSPRMIQQETGRPVSLYTD